MTTINSPLRGIANHVADSDAYLSPAEMMAKMGMDWEVALDDVYMTNGTKIPGSKVTYRTSDNKIFDVVGDRYTPLQNKEAFQWFEPFITSKSAKWENIGTLKDDKVIFVQAKVNIPEVEIIKDDKVASYILLSHSHDGTLSVRAGFTGVRLFCTNQMPKLKRDKSSKLLKMKHTRNLNLAMDTVQQIMDVAKQEFIATTEQYKFLASKPVNKKDLERYVTLFVNKGDEDEDKNIKRTFEKIEECFESGIGQSSATRNYWGLFNAANEMLNYHVGRSQANRIQSLWFGAGADQNELALDIATKMAKGEI